MAAQGNSMSLGFKFDMGPSWYWMPDVFDRYFAQFNKTSKDFYELIRLDPSYKVVYGMNDAMDIPADYQSYRALYESIEPGSALKLDKFIKEAEYKYQVGINKLVYKPSRSLFEFISLRLLLDVMRMDVFVSFKSHTEKYFKNPRLLQLLEFPILFLGALAKNTPALYSLMNYADIKLGTWYPMGGMKSVVDGMVKVAEMQGVTFKFNEPVTSFTYNGNSIKSVKTPKGDYDADVVVAGADYHHVEKHLLEPRFRSYSDSYWESRLLAPSSLLFYLGLNKKIDNLDHHTLFFDEPFGPHAADIYTNKQWPSKPLFYVNIPTKTDKGAAPENHENMVVLIPIAAGLEDNETIREKYYNIIFDRLKSFTGEDLRAAVVYKKSYAVNDFVSDYNSFKGNAYGLANTLMQTAILKPSLKSKKVKNLYYTGQLTVPGPGVPPSLISGEVVANEVIRDFNKNG
ncbi:MAG: phytoene desaturase family protein [Cyclobacteriaceae bacterium]|nr:phytoene desaturase family protein [Cyclobacteriaceae bacterium]